MKGIVLFCALCLSSLSLAAQNVSIQGKLSRSEIKTGEQTTVDLIIRTNNLSQTKFYIQEGKKVGEPYTVLEFGAVDTVAIDESLMEISARLLLTSFDSTLVTIPPIVVETPEGRAETQPMALKVVQPQVDAAHPESFKDIKRPWEVKVGLLDWLSYLFSSWVFLLLMGLALLSIPLYYYFKTRKRVYAVAQEEVPLSLWERTEAELQRIEREALWKSGAYKEYYSALVDLLKAYLDERFGWATAEMTSSELIAKLEREQFSKKHIQDLSSVLTEADLSKFAKAVPSAEVAVEALRLVGTCLSDLEQKAVVSEGGSSPELEDKTNKQ